MLCPFLGWNTQKRSRKFSKPNPGSASSAPSFGHLKRAGIAQCSGKNKFRVLCGVLHIIARRKGSFHHYNENWKRDERCLWRHRVSSDHESVLWGFSCFSNYHTQRHLQDYNLYLPYCSGLPVLEMPFSIHSLYLHKYSLVAENKQSSLHWTLGLNSALEPEKGPWPASHTIRLAIILIIYLIHIKSVVWGGKALFRLRAHQGALGQGGWQALGAALHIEDTSQWALQEVQTSWARDEDSCSIAWAWDH